MGGTQEQQHQDVLTSVLIWCMISQLGISAYVFLLRGIDINIDLVYISAIGLRSEVTTHESCGVRFGDRNLKGR